MDIKERVAEFMPETDSPEKVYELFRGLLYPKDKVLDSTYKRKIQEFDFAKEEKEKVKDTKTLTTTISQGPGRYCVRYLRPES